MDAEPESTVNEGRYLTFIYRKQREESTWVRTTGLARSFGVQPATVTEMFQKLAEKGLLEYTRYHGIRLTEEGIVEAHRLLRKHRLLEVLFVKALNYDVQSACNEASKMDYYASKNLIDGVCRTYGHPLVCPCSKTIFHARECGE